MGRANDVVRGGVRTERTPPLSRQTQKPQGLISFLPPGACLPDSPTTVAWT
jgi:hypothetical protein